MIPVKEVIVVEGRYDKNTLSQVFDAVIIETAGFGVFNDKEKLALLRRLAETRGLVVLTDSDGAGFVIRNFIKGAVDPALVKQAYIPDIPGRERRKSAPSKEGKLGVEGMSPEVLVEALRRAGATLGGEAATHRSGGITKATLYELGLSGGSGSAQRRGALLRSWICPKSSEQMRSWMCSTPCTPSGNSGNSCPTFLNYDACKYNDQQYRLRQSQKFLGNMICITVPDGKAPRVQQKQKCAEQKYAGELQAPDEKFPGRLAHAQHPAKDLQGFHLPAPF